MGAKFGQMSSKFSITSSGKRNMKYWLMMQDNFSFHIWLGYGLSSTWHNQKMFTENVNPKIKEVMRWLWLLQLSIHWNKWSKLFDFQCKRLRKRTKKSKYKMYHILEKWIMWHKLQTCSTFFVCVLYKMYSQFSKSEHVDTLYVLK